MLAALLLVLKEYFSIRVRLKKNNDQVTRKDMPASFFYTFQI